MLRAEIGIAVDGIALDALKVTRRWWRRFRGGASLPERPDARADAHRVLEERADAAALDRALATLEPKVRIAVLLRYEEGLTFEEMSVIAGEKPATLQARVARAMPILRRWMDEHA
jgi:RNA polymerase sigma-70 factor (ECF subfamily)